MIEPGLQPFPEPEPFHGRIGLQVQFEEYVVPSDPGEMVRRTTTGRVRVILTGEGEAMRPYMDAIGKLWEHPEPSIDKSPASADGMGEPPSGGTACRDTLKSAQSLDPEPLLARLAEAEADREDWKERAISREAEVRNLRAALAEAEPQRPDSEQP